MNDMVATEDRNTQSLSMSRKLAILIGIQVVGLHQGPRTCAAPKGRTYDRSRPTRSLRNKACQEAVHICSGGARPPVQTMIAFIDAHREVYGVEPICRVLPIALSTYRAHVARQREGDGATRCNSGQAGKDDDQQQGSTVPARPRQSRVLCAAAEHAVGCGFYIWCASSRTVRGAYDWNAKEKGGDARMPCPLLRGGMSPSGGDLLSTGRVT